MNGKARNIMGPGKMYRCNWTNLGVASVARSKISKNQKVFTATDKILLKKISEQEKLNEQRSK